MKHRMCLMIVLGVVLALGATGVTVAQERLVEGRVVAIEGARVVVQLDDGTYEAFMLPEDRAYPTLAVHDRIEAVLAPVPAGETTTRTVVEQGPAGEVIFEDETVVVGEAPLETFEGEVVIRTGNNIWVSSVMGLEQFTFDEEATPEELYEGRRVNITYFPVEDQRSRVITRVAQAESVEGDLAMQAYCRDLRIVDDQSGTTGTMTDQERQMQAQQMQEQQMQEQQMQEQQMQAQQRMEQERLEQQRAAAAQDTRTVLPQTGTNLPALLLGGLALLLLGGGLAVARRF